MNTDTALQAHLDGDSTAAMAAELSEKFASDVDAAHTAVNAALLHARLAKALGPAVAVAVVESLRRPEPLWRRRPRLVTGVAAAVAVLVASLLWPRGETVIEAPRVPPGAPRVRLVETPALSEVGPMKATESHDFLAELKDKLDRYYVRPTSFENVRTVRGLIAQLQSEVRAVNHQREPFYDAVTFSVPVELEDRALPERFTAAFCGGSAWTVVEAVGALMNWEARAEGEGAVTFTAGEEVERGDEVVTEEVRVAPDWKSWVKGGAKETSATSATDGGDEAEEVIQDLALLGADGFTTAMSRPDSGLIRVRGSQSDVAKAKRLLGAPTRTVPAMVTISTKIVKRAAGIDSLPLVLDQPSFDMWLRAAGAVATRPQGASFEALLEWFVKPIQGRETESITAPRVTMRVAQKSRVEITRDDGADNWTGLRVDFDPRLEGRCIRLESSVELRLVPAAGITTDAEGLIPNGHTALFSLSEKAGDPNIVVAVTATMIDPSGVPK